MFRRNIVSSLILKLNFKKVFTILVQKFIHLLIHSTLIANLKVTREWILINLRKYNSGLNSLIPISHILYSHRLLWCFWAGLSFKYSCCLVAKSCPALLWPHGLLPTRLLCPWDFQARMLEWVAISFSRGSS